MSTVEHVEHDVAIGWTRVGGSDFCPVARRTTTGCDRRGGGRAVRRAAC